MKQASFLVVLLVFALGTSGTLVLTAQQSRAYQSQLDERATEIGYSDGFVKGVRDRQARARTDYRKSFDYQAADRGYEVELGAEAEYKAAYRRSYDAGYEAGFNGYRFTAERATNRDDREPAPRNAVFEDRADRDRGDNRDAAPEAGQQPASQEEVKVPEGIRMRVELLSHVSTKDNKVGDKFTARVLSPERFKDAIVEGHVAKIKSSGRAKGTSEIALAFDIITLNNGTGPSGRFQAQIEDVFDVENAGSIDEEGRVKGKTTRKRDAVKIGGGAAAGALLGGLIGGGKGAAVGAAIGAAAAGTTVLASRGEQMEFPTGTELAIRTGGK